MVFHLQKALLIYILLITRRNATLTSVKQPYKTVVLVQVSSDIFNII